MLINWHDCISNWISGSPKSKNDADEAVSVVSLTSSSGGYINGRNSANLELLIDKTSSIYLYVKVDRYEDKISNTDATTSNVGEIVQSEQYEPAT